MGGGADRGQVGEELIGGRWGGGAGRGQVGEELIGGTGGGADRGRWIIENDWRERKNYNCNAPLQFNMLTLPHIMLTLPHNMLTLPHITQV